MDEHVIDRLFRGVAMGCAITAGISVLLYVALPAALATRLGTAGILGIPPVITALLLFPRPVLLKTLWRGRRAATMLDDEINALMLGIGIGMFSGVWVIARFVLAVL